MITIKKFRDEPYGMFLDYENCPGGVAVNIDTGNVYLSDAPWHPPGPGSLVGMIDRADILNFQSHPTTKGSLKLELHCRFGAGDQETVYQLGETSETTIAQRWLNDANDAIAASDRTEFANLKSIFKKLGGSPANIRDVLEVFEQVSSEVDPKSFGVTTLAEVREKLAALQGRSSSRDSGGRHKPPSEMASGH